MFFVCRNEVTFRLFVSDAIHRTQHPAPLPFEFLNSPPNPLTGYGGP